MHTLTSNFFQKNKTLTCVLQYVEDDHNLPQCPVQNVHIIFTQFIIAPLSSLSLTTTVTLRNYIIQKQNTVVYPSLYVNFIPGREKSKQKYYTRQTKYSILWLIHHNNFFTKKKNYDYQASGASS